MNNYTTACEHIGKMALYYLHRSGALSEFVNSLSLQDRRIVHEWALGPSVDPSTRAAVLTVFDQTRK